jgi:hypothetical protein
MTDVDSVRLIIELIRGHRARSIFTSTARLQDAWLEKMVGETGFEPATLWSQTRCATRLRYSPTWVHWYNNVLPVGLPAEAPKGQRLVGPEGLEPPT